MGLNRSVADYETRTVNRLRLDQDPRMAGVLRKMFDRILQRVLKSRFQGINVQIVGETSLIEGSTSAVTVQVGALLPFMFKLDIETIPKEIEGYTIMEQALPRNTLKPLYCDANAGVLCIPYLANARDLHDVIQYSLLTEADILKMYGDFIRRMKALWNQTYLDRRPDGEDQFIQRLRNRTRRAERVFDTSVAGQELSFSELLRIPLRINGVDYPPLADLLSQAVQLMVENLPLCSVTAHRDEHAKNILIELAANGDVPQWYLVDLPNVSTRADWVWSIAKMRHWWLAYYHIDQAKRIQPPPIHPEEVGVKFLVKPRHVIIEYDLDGRIPPICRKLDQKAEDLAKDMGKSLKDRGWSKRYRASLFLVFYGGIPYHRNCQHVVPILLGEAVKGLFQE